MQFYRPLVSLSYWLDFRTWGLNPAAFHLTNILIQIANVIILFYILIGLSFGPRPAFFGAFLFSVYPLHFENVSWISGRTDLLAFLFAGFSTLFFIRFIKSGPCRPCWVRLWPASWRSCARKTRSSLPLIFSFFFIKRRARTEVSCLSSGPMPWRFSAGSFSGGTPWAQPGWLPQGEPGWIFWRRSDSTAGRWFFRLT